MERLLAKIGMPSYLPTPAEVVEGVRWLRENPALAAGVVVGLTSYSVAKYYEYDEEEEEDVEEARQLLASLSADDSGGMHGETRATREEIAKSVSAIQLGLVKKASSSEERPSIVDSTASTQSSMGSLSGGLRSRASSVFDRALLESAQDSEAELEEHKGCMHGAGECPPGRKCCDPDWGWFVAASARDKKAPQP